MKLVELLTILNSTEEMQISINGELVKSFIPLNLHNKEVLSMNITQTEIDEMLTSISGQTYTIPLLEIELEK